MATPDRLHVVMLSGGASSWLTGRRVKARHGTSNLRLVFADTLIEDEDCYRFLIEGAADILGLPKPDDLMRLALALPLLEDGDLPARKAALASLRQKAVARLPGLVWLCEGRTPWEVFKDERFVGNSHVDPCSKILKRQTLDAWRNANCDQACTVSYVGITWQERHRFDGKDGKGGVKRRFADMGWQVEAPLCDPPHLSDYEVWAEMDRAGIDRPRLYDMGMSHNNCGAFCVPYTTQALTPTGWKSRDALSVGDTVLGYDEQRQVMDWTTITDFTDTTGQLFSIKSKTFRFESTADHRWYGEVRKRVGNGKRERLPATFTTAMLNDNASIRVSAPYVGGTSPISSDQAAMIGWLLTDGGVKWDEVKPRTKYYAGRRLKANIYQKKEPFRSIIRQQFADIISSEAVDEIGMSIFHIKAQPVRDAWEVAGLEPDKENWQQFVMSLSLDARKAFLGAVWGADGYANGSCREFTQNIGPLFEAFLLAGFLDGYRCTVRVHDSRPNLVNGRWAIPSTTHMVVGLASNPFVGGAQATILPTTVAPVWCPTTTLGSWVARQGNTITITGNCVKSGHRQFKQLLANFPKRYAYHEQMEDDMMDYLGRTDATILRDRRGGTTIPLPMSELRRRVEANDAGNLFESGGCSCFAGDD